MAEVNEVKKEKKKGGAMKAFVSWLIGFILGIVVVIGGTFAILKFVPTKSILDLFNVDTDEYVSDNVTSNSVIDAIANFNAYTFDDVKVLKDALIDIAKADAIKDYIEIDEDKLSALKISELSSGISDCIKVTATEKTYLVEILDETNPNNAMIYNVLRDGTGNETNADIKISDLEEFNIEDVKLQSVLDETKASENVLLNALYSDDTVTIGNISQKANEIYLSDIYPTECFITGDMNYKAKYRQEEDEYGCVYYVRDDAGEYYISASTKVWFFVFYSAEDGDDADTLVHDTNGNADVYRPTNLKFKDMQNTVDNMNDKVVNSTIQELIDTGVLNGTYDAGIHALTLEEALANI